MNTINRTRQNHTIDSLPLISCVMPTYGRPLYVNESVAMFLAQDYPNKELIVLNDCPGQWYRFDHPDVRVINLPNRYPTLGEKRNASIEAAAGEIIAVWDDDDVYLPWRLSFSYQQMLTQNTPFYRPAEFWAYWGESSLQTNRCVPGWVNHGTAMFEKSLWEQVDGYPAQNVGEDARFFKSVHRLLNQEFICYPISQYDRFFVLRGKSHYQHMSIQGGENPLDLTPGIYRIEPTKIQDNVLRHACDRLVTEQAKTSASPILSVCVSLKNRSRIQHENQTLELFPNCVRSLAQAAAELSAGSVELLVADFHSDDWPLDQWIDDAAGNVAVQVFPINGYFSRGRGLNIAARNAVSDCLLLLDADMLIPTGFLAAGIKQVQQSQAYFPIFRYLDIAGNPKNLEPYSYGSVFVSRFLFDEVGGIPEFKSWGGEDDIFRDRVKSKTTIVRNEFTGFDHQWHPEHCRHEHYVNSIRSDYYDFLNNKQRAGKEG